MIDNQTIWHVLGDLDKKLKSTNEEREIIIFGSGALILQGISNKFRATVDIDMVKPEIDIHLQLQCAEVGEKYGFDLTWLNSAGAIFSRNFPRGWESRTVEVYKGDALKVKSLARKDLIATKLYAASSRADQMDFVDLNDLKPTRQELDFARRWVKTQDDYFDIKSLVETNYKKYLELSIEGYGR